MVALAEPNEKLSHRPGHALDYAGGIWICPRTGASVDMDVGENVKQRARIIRACKNNPKEQLRMRRMCARSFPLWCNLFAWTYVVYEVKQEGELEGRRVAKLDDKDRPFIMWPVQENCYDAIEAARAMGRDIAIPKSRDMGATWLALAWIVWMALFHGSPMGVASRKEDLVEKAGDPDALFTKIDYMVSWMPPWMVGEIDRHSLHIGFKRSGGTVDGESTNKHAFRGGRKHGILFDEAAAMDNLAAIVRASKDSGLRLFVSTHEEVSHFYELCTSDRVDVFTLGWWDHPEKGRGREVSLDEKTGSPQWSSPWYRIQLLERDPKDLALNVDIRPGGDGSLVFDLGTLIRQESLFGVDAYHRGILGFEEGVKIDREARASGWPIDRLEFDEDDVPPPTADDDGVWQLWCDLIQDSQGRWRPDQGHGYSMGVDVGDGVNATPSVITICDVDTGYKVARWQSRKTRPEELSHLIYQIGHFFGGTNKVPVCVVEANGGRAVGILIDLKRWRYPRIYRHKEMDAKRGKKGMKLGWHSNGPRKKALLATYGGNLFRGYFKNPDIPALKQSRTYIHIRDDMGRGSRVAPKRLGHLNDVDLAEHGDLVIADALADLGRMHAPTLIAEESQPNKGTVGWARKQGKKNDDAWRP